MIAWGDPASGSDTTNVVTHLQGDVVDIIANNNAFAALKSDGSVITWGYKFAGRTQGEAANKLSSGVKEILGFNHIFIAFKENGSSVVWGNNSPYIESRVNIATDLMLSNRRTYWNSLISPDVALAKNAKGHSFPLEYSDFIQCLGVNPN